MQIKVDFSGLQRVMRETPEKAERWLDGVAENMVTDIKLSFGESPSPAGGPPGVDTGALRASIRWEKTGAMERRIMDGVEYGVLLEDGTEHIAPRPFMGPVFARWQRRVESDAKKNLGIE